MRPIFTAALTVGGDAVHVEQAARALGVSRRTVERMIERGELERVSQHGGAAVTKRSPD